MNYEHIKLGESLQPFRPESFVLCVLSKHTQRLKYVQLYFFPMFNTSAKLCLWY